MKTDTPETRALDRAAALEPGECRHLRFKTPKACALFRYRLYNTRRQFRAWSRKAYKVGTHAYDLTPWDDVTITRVADTELALMKRKEVQPEEVENGGAS